VDVPQYVAFSEGSVSSLKLLKRTSSRQLIVAGT
jgi:hypothetical protein